MKKISKIIAVILIILMLFSGCTNKKDAANIALVTSTSTGRHENNSTSLTNTSKSADDFKKEQKKNSHCL